MNFKLKKLRMENFKGFQEAEFEFYDYTKVTGANGLGKSTLAEAYMWLFWNISYSLSSNPNIRRKVGGKPVNDVIVAVEAALDFDGTEITVRKQQKRTIKKDGSFSDDNTYFINDAPKTLRDFNEYFGVDMIVFELCSNVNAFLAQKPGEMREFLFCLVKDITNLDVASQFEELAELVPLLEKYSPEELAAMNKATIKKINAELDGIPAAIVENRRYLVDDSNLAELELQKNALTEETVSIQAQLDSSEESRAVWQKKSNEIMELQARKLEMEREAAGALNRNRSEIRRRMDVAEDGFNRSVASHNKAEQAISQIEQKIKDKESQKEDLQKRYAEERQKPFRREGEQFTEISEDDLICPTCGQPLPDELREKKIAESEAAKAAFYEKLESDRAYFYQAKRNALEAINEQGRSLMKAIARHREEIEMLQASIEEAKTGKVRCNAEKSAAMEELNSLPVKTDLSGNQEYATLCAKIEEKEKSLKEESAGADYRVVLRGKLEKVQSELDGVKAKIQAIIRNGEFEQRIADLEEKRRTLEQKKADSEKVLYLLDKLDERKNTLLVDEINSHFKYVKWDLFSRAKNGSYLKNYCKPVIDGKAYGDDTNTGLEILARLDIAMAVQEATGIYCPIFLDYGESIDSWRIPKGESQLIVLCRTDDDKLEVKEVAA